MARAAVCSFVGAMAIVIVVTSYSGSNETGADDSDCSETWVYGLNWATTSIVGGHAARKHERASGEECDEEFCFHSGC